MSTLREALETALAENPDDIATHMAYADHLHDQGDPRGELIQVQLALEDEQRSAGERERLRLREKELLDAHLRTWLGGLAPFLLDQAGVGEWQRQRGQGNTFQLRRGWLDRIDWLELGLGELRAMTACPLVRLIRTLKMEDVAYTEKQDQDFAELGLGAKPEVSSILYRLSLAPWVGGLQHLSIGEDCLDSDEDSFNCRSFAEGIHVLVAKTPRLRSLRLFAHQVEPSLLFALPTLGQLRELVYFHGDGFDCHKLGDNPVLGNLHTLVIHPGHVWEGDPSPTGLGSVRPLFTSPHLTGLRHLALRISDMGDEGCRELVSSGLLDRLRVLDLQHGCIGDEGARLLAEAPATARLEKLDLSDNEITEEGWAVLVAAGLPLVGDCDSQHEPEDTDWRFMGDIE